MKEKGADVPPNEKAVLGSAGGTPAAAPGAGRLKEKGLTVRSADLLPKAKGAGAGMLDDVDGRPGMLGKAGTAGREKAGAAGLGAGSWARPKVKGAGADGAADGADAEAAGAGAVAGALLLGAAIFVPLVLFPLAVAVDASSEYLSFRPF